MSDAITTHETARAFLGRHGDKAALEVGKREREARAAGKDAEAEEWHRVRQALDVMRGPSMT